MKTLTRKRYEKPVIIIVKAEMQSICARSTPTISVSPDPATGDACGKENNTGMSGGSSLWDDWEGGDK